MDILKIKEQVIEAGKELSRSGLIARTWGNVSARTGEDEFAITASGRDYMTLTPEEVIQVKMEDLSYEGEVKPSSEKKVHKEIYRLKPEAGFVIHTHQSNASAVSAMGLDVIKLPKDYPGIGRRIIVGGYGLPGTKKLCENTAEAVKASYGNAVIMKNHGAVVWGKDYEDAFRNARTLEEACGDYLREIGVEPWVEGEASYELWNTDPNILKYIGVKDELRPYLDDFAQLVGPKMKVVEYDEAVVEEAIANGTPILVRGKGALCAGRNDDEIEAFNIVIEKNCRAALAAIGGEPLSKFESHLMRQVFLRKYSKLKK